MRGMNEIELQETVMRNGGGMPFILITAFPETALTVRAIKNGAVTLLDKPYKDEHLIEAVRAALQLDHTMRAKREESKRTAALLAKLTAAERQVLDLARTGLPNKVIAYELGVKPAHGRAPASPSAQEVESRLDRRSGASDAADRVVKSPDQPLVAYSNSADGVPEAVRAAYIGPMLAQADRLPPGALAELQAAGPHEGAEGPP